MWVRSMGLTGTPPSQALSLGNLDPDASTVPSSEGKLRPRGCAPSSPPRAAMQASTSRPLSLEPPRLCPAMIYVPEVKSQAGTRGRPRGAELEGGSCPCDPGGWGLASPLSPQAR